MTMRAMRPLPSWNGWIASSPQCAPAAAPVSSMSERAAMRILPGSHRAIQRHWEETLKPEHRSLLPRVHGLFPSPSPSYPSYPEFVPEPEDFKYTTCEPTPVAVPRGTAQIFVRRC